MTSSFNVRLPELLCVNSLQMYAECFRIVGKQMPNFRVDLHLQPWFDGLSRRVKLRSTSVNDVVGFVMKQANAGSLAAAEMLASVFAGIAAGDPELWQRFVDCSSSTQTVSVVSLVKPWDATKFLTHVCLSMG